VYEDYRKAFGENPESPQAVVVSIDTNDTHSTAEAFIGRIVFTKGSGEAALNR
jgi:ribosomal protein L35AE/L33A